MASDLDAISLVNATMVEIGKCSDSTGFHKGRHEYITFKVGIEKKQKNYDVEK